MKTIAVIIARGGSKRVPRKNVRPICGLPLVAWSVIQATCSRTIDHVYLSTDDDEIEEIGLSWGANIIRRPDWPDADKAAGNRPYSHAVDVLEEEHGMDYCMVQVLPTSPQRLPDDLDRGVSMWNSCRGHLIAAAPRRETFIARNVSGVVARHVLRDKYGKYLDPCSGLVNIIHPETYRFFISHLESDLDEDLNRDMQDEYIENDMYWIECQPWQQFEVDTPVEFELTEALFNHFVLKGRGPEIYYDYAGLGMPIGMLAGNWRQQ